MADNNRSHDTYDTTNAELNPRSPRGSRDIVPEHLDELPDMDNVEELVGEGHVYDEETAGALVALMFAKQHQDDQPIIAQPSEEQEIPPAEQIAPEPVAPPKKKKGGKAGIIIAVFAIIGVIIAVLMNRNGNDTVIGGHGDQICDTHVDQNRDMRCDLCGKEVAETGVSSKPASGVNGEELPAVSWTATADLIFQMTDNSNYDELSSGCKRFLSGESDDTGFVVQNAKDRNTDAYNYANVDVTYLYYPNSSGYGWGSTINFIYMTATSDTEKGRPDIFTNFVYDMVSASLIRSFKNLYNGTYASENVRVGNRLNYFSFAKDGKYDASYTDTGKGYMIDYMRSLTLSEDKMYLVASDYFTDIIRSEYVIPVNVAILESGAIPASSNPADYNYDYNRNGIYDFEDLRSLINAGRWSYDSVKAFSNMVYIEGPFDNILDVNASGRYGFALGSGGMGASALLYSSSLKIIDRTVETFPSLDPDNPGLIQAYNYYYPETPVQLVEITNSISELFTSPGVAAIEIGVNSTESISSEMVVRNAFARGQVLFGGIVPLGQLEDSKYRDMATNGGKGFGIAPIPLYRTGYQDEYGVTHAQEYITQVHNTAKVGAIAVKSTRFAQCSAFLDYSSLNSEEVLRAYYDLVLMSDNAYTPDGNIEIADLVRSSLGSAFDKTFEDAIARHAFGSGDSTLNSYKWHNVIYENRFVLEPGAMREFYDSLVDMKNMYLEQIAQSYASLPE